MDFTDGDVYFNPLWGDLWLVKGHEFLLINKNYKTDLCDPKGFVKVGHIDFQSIERNNNNKEG